MSGRPSQLRPTPTPTTAPTTARRAARAAVASLLVAAAATLGVIATPASTASAMSGGTPLPARPSLVPWMASLVVRGEGPPAARLSCGGALIGPRTVLTAAHCTAGLTAAQVSAQAEVHIGATTLSIAPGTVRRITAVRVHPRFRLIPSPAAPDSPESASATYDVELLTLDRPVTTVRPVPISSSGPGRTVVLLGHGITGPDAAQSDPLRAGLFVTGRPDACRRATPATVDPAAMGCAFPVPLPRRAEACTGDSGGPVVTLDRRGRPELVGVFSFAMETAGRPCGAPGPLFMTRGDVVESWLARRPA